MADRAQQKRPHSAIDQRTPGEGQPFTLKNLAAGEFPMRIGPGLYTMKRWIRSQFGIPNHLIRLNCNRGDCQGITNEKRYIAGWMGSHQFETYRPKPDRELYVWLIWMRSNDYIIPDTSGMFSQPRNMPLKPIMICSYIAIARDLLASFRKLVHYQKE